MGDVKVNELDESKLVTLYSPADEAEYIVFVSLLEEQGIEYLTKNKNIQNLFGAGQSITGYNLITGEQAVMVHENDFEKANEILSAFQNNKNKLSENEEKIQPDELNDEELKNKYDRYLNHSIILNLFLPFIGFFFFFKALMMKILYPFRGLRGNIRLIVSFIFLFMWVFFFFSFVIN